jgi:hypothetical protein
MRAGDWALRIMVKHIEWDRDDLFIFILPNIELTGLLLQRQVSVSVRQTVRKSAPQKKT